MSYRVERQIVNEQGTWWVKVIDFSDLAGVRYWMKHKNPDLSKFRLRRLTLTMVKSWPSQVLPSQVDP